MKDPGERDSCEISPSGRLEFVLEASFQLGDIDVGRGIDERIQGLIDRFPGDAPLIGGGGGVSERINKDLDLIHGSFEHRVNGVPAE